MDHRVSRTHPIPNRNVGKAVEKQIEAVPVEVPFYGRMIEALVVAKADDKGISPTFLDRVSERYRNRLGRVTEPVYGSEKGQKTTLRLTNTNTRPPVEFRRKTLRSWRPSAPGMKLLLAIHDGRRLKTSVQAVVMPCKPVFVMQMV